MVLHLSAVADLQIKNKKCLTALRNFPPKIIFALLDMHKFV